MWQQLTGALIGAIFGMLFVVINAHEPLDNTIGIILCVLAVLALASLIVISALAIKRAGSMNTRAPTIVQNAGFGPKYWFVVAGEVVMLIGGLVILRSRNTPQEINIGWIAFVVGIHFVALATIWNQRTLIVPGSILTALGVAGLLMATTAVVAWIPIVSGVLSVITLLAFSLTYTTRTWRSLQEEHH